MSNIYLKVIIQKNWRFQNFDFLSLKNLPTRSIFGELQLTQISYNFQTSCYKLKIKKLCVAFLFNFERNYDALKLKSPCILLNKNINVNKNEAGSKMGNPTQSLEKQTLCFNSYKNHNLKKNLWWVRARQWKRGHFTVLSE